VTYLARLGGIRDADIADVVQEVFIIFDRELLGGLDTSGSLRRWFRRTCFRKARDHRRLVREREQPARAGAIELTEMADAAPTPEERTMAIDMLGNVQAVLDRLPQEQRLVLVMSDLEEMPGREIAEVLEIPEGTVSSRLLAGRKAFHRAWEERRASGLAAVAPFALWDADSMLKLLHQEEPLPPGFEEEVWRRLVDRIPGLSASAAAGAVAGAATAGAVLSVKQAVVGALLSALVGAGIYAAVRPQVGAAEVSKDESASVAVAARPAVAASASASSAVVMMATSLPVVAAVPSASASSPVVVAPAPDAEASDRLLLDKARAAIDREDYGGAQAALRRVRSARFAGDRDRLLRDVAAHLDGGR
jgi:RNA polymerase sigma factor (sigma-70 family)